MRPPKIKVIELLKERGLTMRRRTFSNGRRAWVVSDGKAFPSLKAVYAFYAAKEDNKSGIGYLLDKIREEEE